MKKEIIKLLNASVSLSHAIEQNVILEQDFDSLADRIVKLLPLQRVMPSTLPKEKHSTIIKNGCPECGSDITDGTANGWQVCQNTECGAMI
jgi:hypothetical protein